MIRAARHVVSCAITTVLLGWLLLGCCHKPKPTVQIPAPPVVTIAPTVDCILPERKPKPALWVEAIEDGRLAASQFHWADVVGYILAAEARLDASDACLAAPR